MSKVSGLRINSIDVFRAFTMFLMIFVNDLWTLSGIPSWLEHTPTHTDGMGLADIVFPAFLVVMGMSIPYAIQNRIQRGHSNTRIIKHILFRSLALLIMGVFTVNTPSMNSEATGMNKLWYEILVVACFFLIWNVYPISDGKRKYFYYGLQGLGMIVLIVFALIYRGGGEGQDPLVHFTPRWWGILGLIGWAYLGSATLYLFFRNKIWLLILCWVFFTVFNILGHSGMLGHGEWFVGNGAFHAFTFVGILATILFKKLATAESSKKFIFSTLMIAMGLIVAGFISRNFFILSKNLATPPWIFICSGISLFLFTGIYILVDLNGKEKWFSIIKTAGTNTLTCYLIPYLFYDFTELYGWSLPSWLKTGAIGIGKSILFSLLIIGITTVLGKIKIKLKI